MAGLKVPSMNQIITLAVTIAVLFFIIRIAPIPDSFKNLFRV